MELEKRKTEVMIITWLRTPVLYSLPNTELLWSYLHPRVSSGSFERFTGLHIFTDFTFYSRTAYTKWAEGLKTVLETLRVVVSCLWESYGKPVKYHNGSCHVLSHLRPDSSFFLPWSKMVAAICEQEAAIQSLLSALLYKKGDRVRVDWQFPDSAWCSLHSSNLPSEVILHVCNWAWLVSCHLYKPQALGTVWGTGLSGDPSFPKKPKLPVSPSLHPASFSIQDLAYRWFFVPKLWWSDDLLLPYSRAVLPTCGVQPFEEEHISSPALSAIYIMIHVAKLQF